MGARRTGGVYGRRPRSGSMMAARALIGGLWTEKWKLVLSVSGLVGTLVLYGVMQERLMSVPYGEGKDAEHFKFSLFLVLCNRLLTSAAAIIFLLVQRKEMAPVAPIHKYGAISLSNVIATTCQYEALKYVSFPVQTLAKSAKMIPVMIWGTAILQKQYNCRDYVIAVCVTMGCSFFLLTGDNVAVGKKQWASESTVWGIAIMCCYLGFDGFTSTFQDKLFKGYSMDIFNQILYVTLCSSALSTIGLISSGHFVQAVQFVSRHPRCLGDIIFLSLAASTAQFFISFTIRTFGALTFATIMTTRQLISIILSCIWFAHSLSTGQVFGTVVVFGGLYYKSYGNFKRRPSSELNSREEPAKLDVSFDVENFKKRSSEVNVRGEPLKVDVTFDIEMGKGSDEGETGGKQLRGFDVSLSPSIVRIPSPAKP